MWFHAWQLSWFSQSWHIGGVTLNTNVLAQTGYIAVELFLYISGFCLFYPLIKQHDAYDAPGRGTQLTFKNFPYRKYALRRCAKILPSYYFSLFIALVFFNQTLKHSPDLWKHIVTHLTLTHHFFPDTSMSIIGVLWSLSVGAQFYVMFPVLAISFMRRPKTVFFTMFFGAIAFRQFVARVYPGFYSSFFNNQLPAFFDIYATGMATAWIVVKAERRGLQKKPWMWSVLSVVSLFLTYAVLQDLYHFAFEQDGIIRWQTNHRQVLAACFMLVGCSLSLASSGFRKFFANPVAIWFSTISYNLYIWHGLVIYEMLRYQFIGFATQDAHDDRIWQRAFFWLSMCASITVAAIVTELIEKPILRWVRAR